MGARIFEVEAGNASREGRVTVKDRLERSTSSRHRSLSRLGD